MRFSCNIWFFDLRSCTSSCSFPLSCFSLVKVSRRSDIYSFFSSRFFSKTFFSISVFYNFCFIYSICFCFASSIIFFYLNSSSSYTDSLLSLIKLYLSFSLSSNYPFKRYNYSKIFCFSLSLSLSFYSRFKDVKLVSAVSFDTLP